MNLQEVIDALSEDERAIYRHFAGAKPGEELPAWFEVVWLADLLHIPPWQVEQAVSDHPEWVARVVVAYTAKRDAANRGMRKKRYESLHRNGG